MSGTGPTGPAPGAPPADAPPKYRTGVIWLVLSVLLGAGTVAAAFFVWGLTGLFGSGPIVLDVAAIVLGAGVALYVMMLLAGVLYRIDRLRGVPHRRIEIFE